MTTLLKQPNQLAQKTIFSGLIYGQPGIGKTTLAISASKPACIDVDRGMQRVEMRFQVPSLPVDNYQQVIDLIEGDELKDYDTLVIDTLGKLVDRIGDHVCNNNPKLRQGDGSLAMKGWGAVKIEFQALLRRIQSKNKSVIFVAHESEEKDGDATKKRPDVSGSARKDIVKELDWMGYMKAVGGKRTICFTPSEDFYAKNSVGLDGIIEIPDIANGNTFVQDKIISAIQERRKKDQEMLDKYESTKKVITGMIDNVKNLEMLNDTLKSFGQVEEVWDSKRFAFNSLKDKATALGFEYDATAKAFAERKAA